MAASPSHPASPSGRQHLDALMSSRDAEGLIKPAAVQLIHSNVVGALNCVRFLRDEMMNDRQEGAVNAITPEKAFDTVFERLRLLNTVLPKMAAQTETQEANVQPLANLGVTPEDLYKFYIPLALRINKEVRDNKQMRLRMNMPHKAFCLGIYAPPGSGKSTLVKLVVFLLKVLAEQEHEELNVAKVSSDDFYCASRDRTPGHTRLHVDEIDNALAVEVLTSLKAQCSKNAETAVPVFSKGKDDREPGSTWPIVRGRVDLVLYEGWRVGIQHPRYLEMNKEIDFLIYLDTDLAIVREWKVQSSREDKQAIGKLHEFDADAVRHLWDTQIQPDVEFFAESLKKKADLVMTKNQSHSIMNIDVQFVEKIYNVFHVCTTPYTGNSTMFSCNLRVALASLGLKLDLVRWCHELLWRRQLAGDQHVHIDWKDGEDMPRTLALTEEVFTQTIVAATNSNYFVNDAHAHLRTVAIPAADESKQGTSEFCCATGASEAADIDQAVEEAVAQIQKDGNLSPADTTVLFVQVTASHNPDRLAAALDATYGKFGTIIHGFTTCQGAMTQHDLLGAMTPNVASTALALFAIADEKGTFLQGSAALGVQSTQFEAFKAGLKAASRVKEQAENRGGAPAMIYVSATPGHEEQVLAGIKQVMGNEVQLFGGSAADDDISESWWLLAGRQTFGNGVVLTAMTPSVQMFIQLISLYTPTETVGEIGLCGARTIHTIKDVGGMQRPARDVYNDWTGGVIDHTLTTAGAENINILAESTVFPLAIEVKEKGNIFYKLVHPREAVRDGSMTIFADCTGGDKLRLLKATSDELTESIGHTMSKALDAAGSGCRGAMLIFCAGMMLGVRAHGGMDTVRNRIQQALPTNTPFVTSFTFGEQGPLGSFKEDAVASSCHANLMLNVLIFADPITRL